MATKWGDREGRRRDILRAGRMLLREKGLVALQMREVAREAGIALGTVYRYFPTKEALFAVMYAERLDQMYAELEPVMNQTAEFEDQFVAVATMYRDVYAEFGKEIDIMAILGQRPDLEPEARDQLVTAALRLLSWFRKLIDDAGVDEPDLAVTVLWSTVVGLANRFTSARHEVLTHAWDDTVEFAARTLVRGLAIERSQ